ncbi:MAG TPA: DNA polymerase III subunit beta [Solirubrobacteraceae bacterium]|jgi:DNA polymerase-3 subunit beta
MHLKLSTAAFLEELQTAARVASTRSAVQALSGVQLHAEGNAAELRATDMEVGLRLPLSATVETPGDVVLPARLLLDVVRSLPGPEVSLQLRTAEQDVEITSAGATFRLRTLRNEDFPHLPSAGGENAISLEAGPFIDTVARVSRSASRDETRPVLTGILVSATDRELRMVATDSYRLSVKTTKLEESLSAPLEANVPARALAEVVRIAQQSEVPTIAVSRSENQIVFTLGAAVLSSRLIDGQFPNYQLLLPETADHELRVDREELAAVVRRISLLAQKNAPLRLSFSEGELLISAQTPDVGEAREALPVPFSGEAFDIGFNADFLRDGLESVESDDVVIKLTSALRPGLIESADGSEFVYLVMPIRLNT